MTTSRWRAHLMRYLFRPRRYVAEWASARRGNADATTTHRRAAVHVRNGDKSHGNSVQVAEMKQAGFDVALERLNQIRETCAFESVFLATRDPPVIAAARDLSGKCAFNVTFDEQQLRYGDGFHTLDLVTGHLNKTEEMFQYIKDVLWLVDNDVFVGAMESNLARLVAELGGAWGRFVVPPVALLDGGYIVWP